MKSDDCLICVCSECLCASCWQGEFSCSNHLISDTCFKTVKELKKLKYEASYYWNAEIKYQVEESLK